MAYEDMEYEVILERMIDRVSDQYPNLDTREGSIIYNALAPAALELAVAYTELDNVLSESFVETASREYLLLKCKEVGIDTNIFDATFGSHRGEFDVEVPIGSRWNCDLFNYEVIEYLDNTTGYYAYKLRCETEGTEPNNTIGDLTPLDDEPDGLTYAKLLDCLIEGEAENTDEYIRDFYFDYIQHSTSDGNVNQYKQWCNEYEGIGESKVFPLWNGANTVKVSILSASNRAATEELVDTFQEYIDPGCTGMGDGVAPIGAFVTVTTATEVPISVSAKVNLEPGYTDTNAITTALEKYFASMAYKKTTLSYMNVGMTILNVEGVESITDLKVNNATVDINLGVEEIPIMGAVNWVVS